MHASTIEADRPDGLDEFFFKGPEMLGRRSVMLAALATLVMLTIGTAARQSQPSAAPEIVWQFSAGG
jgi:hypothetical protein